MQVLACQSDEHTDDRYSDLPVIHHTSNLTLSNTSSILSISYHLNYLVPRVYWLPELRRSSLVGLTEQNNTCKQIKDPRNRLGGKPSQGASPPITGGACTIKLVVFYDLAIEVRSMGCRVPPAALRFCRQTTASAGFRVWLPAVPRRE